MKIIYMWLILVALKLLSYLSQIKNFYLHENECIHCTIFVQSNSDSVGVTPLGEITNTINKRLILMRHGMRQDHVIGRDNFYKITNAPWDSPLDASWMRVNAHKCSSEWKTWLKQFGVTEISSSPLKRALSTAEFLVNVGEQHLSSYRAINIRELRDSPQTIDDRVGIESCAVESWESVQNHIQSFKKQYPNREMRSNIVTHNSIRNRWNASRCVSDYHGLSHEMLLPHCVPRDHDVPNYTATTGGATSDTNSRIKNFVRCMDIRETTKLVISHAGIIRNICYEMTKDLRCFMTLISYMDALEFISIDVKNSNSAYPQWKFAKKHTRLKC